MTTPAENKVRLDELEKRMDKYDEIIRDLHTIVIALKAKADTNQRWVASMLTIVATVLGATVGVLISHLIH